MDRLLLILTGSCKVTGSRIAEDNSGVVEYNGVEYNTIMQGRKSIPKGTKVSLEFRQGHYISSW